VQVVARGTLAYAVGYAGDRLVTVELVERFGLEIRDPGDATPRMLDLGPAERDWAALACAGDRAWVGGDGGEVVVVDVAQGRELERWPIGAPVTALAVAGDLIAIGDATGVLCLRRADDGALLQCVVAHDGPIAGLALDGGALVSRGADGAHAWQVPSLTGPTPGVALGLSWGDRRVVVDGPRVRDAGGALVVEMSGPVRGLAVSPSGDLAVAAWIHALDQPSVVLVRR
jgi:hypothetical protein